jgi:hypothetical protein
MARLLEALSAWWWSILTDVISRPGFWAGGRIVTEGSSRSHGRGDRGAASVEGPSTMRLYRCLCPGFVLT